MNDWENKEFWLWVGMLLPPLGFGWFNFSWVIGLIVMVLSFVLWIKEVGIRNYFLYQWEAWWFLGWVLISSLSSLVGVGSEFDFIGFIRMWLKMLLGLGWLWINFVLGVRNRGDGVLRAILITSLLKLIMEIGLYFKIKIFLFNIFVSKFVTSIKENLLRGRTIISFFEESFVPIWIWFILKKKAVWGVVVIVVMGAIVFLSNWRGRLIVYILSLMLSWLMFYKNRISWKQWLIYFLSLTILFAIVDVIALHWRGFSVMDRFMMRDVNQDKKTVDWRILAFRDAKVMGEHSVLGVGLGQFYLFTSLKKKFPSRIEDASLYGPHNIFFQFLAETGWIGLVWLIVGLLIFVKNDLECSKVRRCKFLSLVFWLVVLVVQFYPAEGWEFFSLFFGLRGWLIGRNVSNSEVSEKSISCR